MPHHSFSKLPFWSAKIAAAPLLATTFLTSDIPPSHSIVSHASVVRDVPPGFTHDAHLSPLPPCSSAVQVVSLSIFFDSLNKSLASSRGTEVKSAQSWESVLGSKSSHWAQMNSRSFTIGTFTQTLVTLSPLPAHSPLRFGAM